MASGNIPLPWFEQPWTEERAGKVIATELDVVFPPRVKPIEWMSTLVKLISNIRHREIFMYRYGLVDGMFHTYDEVAVQYHFSRSRAYQVDQEIFGRLKRRLYDLQEV